MGKGPSYFVDAAKGDDRNDGGKEKPWKTHRPCGQAAQGGRYALPARRQLSRERLRRPGGQERRPDHHPLRPGRAGHSRRRPGASSQDNPADAWEPFPAAARASIARRSAIPNLRNVVGSFGDSMVGLQTYYHAIDLRASSELIDWEKPERAWQHRHQAALVRARACGTTTRPDTSTSAWPTRICPRRCRTIAARPTRASCRWSSPRSPRRRCTLDGAKHVRFQDLVIRGAGTPPSRSIRRRTSSSTTSRSGAAPTACARRGRGNLRVPALGPVRQRRPVDVPRRRQQARLSRPAAPQHLAAQHARPAGDRVGPRVVGLRHAAERSTGRSPTASSPTPTTALTSASINVRFHHNLIENLQDDGIYLSPMYHAASPRQARSGDSHLSERLPRPADGAGVRRHRGDDARQGVHLSQRLRPAHEGADGPADGARGGGGLQHRQGDRRSRLAALVGDEHLSQHVRHGRGVATRGHGDARGVEAGATAARVQQHLPASGSDAGVRRRRSRRTMSSRTAISTGRRAPRRRRRRSSTGIAPRRCSPRARRTIRPAARRTRWSPIRSCARAIRACRRDRPAVDAGVALDENGPIRSKAGQGQA